MFIFNSGRDGFGKDAPDDCILRILAEASKQTVPRGLPPQHIAQLDGRVQKVRS